MSQKADEMASLI